MTSNTSPATTDLYVNKIYEFTNYDQGIVPGFQHDVKLLINPYTVLYMQLNLIMYINMLANT